MYKLPMNLLGKPLKVLVIGVGGTGSAIAKELVQLDTTLKALDERGGFDVTLADGSNVSEANIARQSFFPTQVGENKAEAMAWTANNLYGKEWHAMNTHFDVSKNASVFRSFDIVITALDRPSVRYAISLSKANFLWLDMGNDATSGQVVIGEVSTKEKTLPNICDFYDYSELSDADAEIKSCSAEESISRQELGVNQFAARIGAQLLWNLIRHGELKSNGAFFDAKALSVDPITKDEWQFLGFETTRQSA
ncbi:PRTRC system ThiF family protein [Enterovibrio norvegicus]|uniref:PRTRC system ThiF family protein n=1 Tax=Enterovibrio norvegicus TaxID=188144 RepID=UPI000C8167AC|nr:PRTRC system ThiF family protein [Enterovibrio norvegicus]PMH64540.1 hypothetical protein BCU62_15915 [Enterovibrio norvegicus]